MVRIRSGEATVWHATNGAGDKPRCRKTDVRCYCSQGISRPELVVQRHPAVRVGAGALGKRLSDASDYRDRAPGNHKRQNPYCNHHDDGIQHDRHLLSVHAAARAGSVSAA